MQNVCDELEHLKKEFKQDLVILMIVGEGKTRGNVYNEPEVVRIK